MRGSWRTPPAPLKTAVPLAFITRYSDATSGPTAGLASVTSAHSKGLHSDATVFSPELAQDEPPSSATSNHSRAAQVDNADLTTTSTALAACFLGIPTEVRYMIYGYLWAPIIDLYIDSPSHIKPNAIHSIFQVSRQVRLESIDSLRRTKSLTFNIHAIVKDLDFSRITNMLEDLSHNKYSQARDGGIGRLFIHLSLRRGDPQRPPSAPESIETFIECLQKLGLDVWYKYLPTNKDGVKIERCFVECHRAITSRLRSSFVVDMPSDVRIRGGKVRNLT
jgi:hypothetical protein